MLRWRLGSVLVRVTVILLIAGWIGLAWRAPQLLQQLAQKLHLPVEPLPLHAQPLVWALAGWGLVLVSLVLGITVGFALRFDRQVRQLVVAAQRIGQGDLLSEVPPMAGNALGTLAQTLDDMRQHLLQLTTDVQRRETESHALLNGISDGVFAVDRERRIQYLNPQTAALLGLSAPEVVGRFCGDVLNPVGRPCASQCPILHARFQGQVRATESLRLANGQIRLVVITSAAPPPQHMIFQQVQVVRDETEAEATRRLRDSVLANISHEFRTPLSAQLASLELLLDQFPTLSPEETRQLIDSLHRGTLRLTQLVDNLLESARVEAGQGHIRRHAVVLEDVVDEARLLIQPLFDQRQQTVRVELPAEFPVIQGDAPRLTQVLINILANANKFAPPGSRITVGGACTPTEIHLWVQDEGPGLPPLPAEGLFARWVRATEGEPAPSGVGLGLWIVKSIIERHGGRVAAQSTQPGTRVTLTLPWRVDEDLDRG